MASTYDVAPALGHGIVTAQGLAGGYDAIDDRRQWSIGRQEGATSATAYKVEPKSEGANLSVDIATDEGHYLVQGDDVLYQGLYLIPATALKTNLSLADPPDITRPRLDQIVVEARDDAHTSDGITRGRVYVLSGTPTTGATLTNRTGAADLPDSTALLADVLVAANATTITSGDIQDRRTNALGNRKRGAGDGAGDASTTSAGFSVFTPAIATMECSGAPVEIRFTAPVFNTGASGGVLLTGMMDGVEAGGRIIRQEVDTSSPDPITVTSYVAAPTPGRHSFTFGYAIWAGGTATVKNSQGIVPFVEARELLTFEMG